MSREGGLMFGVWVMDAGGRCAHYVLDGKLLCGKALPKRLVRARGEADLARKATNYNHPDPHYVPYCEACVAANVDRWAGVTTEGGAG